MDTNLLALAIKKYGVDTVLKMAQDFNNQVNKKFIVDENGNRTATPEAIQEAINMASITGGVNFATKPNQFIRVGGKLAGSTPTVTKNIPYFTDKGVNIVQDALGNLKRTDLPSVDFNAVKKSYIPFANQGNWIKDALGNLVRTDLPSVK